MKSPESELNDEEKKAYDIYMEELKQSFRPMAFKFVKLWIGKGICDEETLHHLATTDVMHQTFFDVVGPNCDKAKV